MPGQLREAGVALAQVAAGQGGHLLAVAEQHGVEPGQALDQKHGHGGGRFQGAVGGEVHHGFVALVADAREHRQGKSPHGRRQAILVEGHQIGPAAAAPDDDHGVELPAPRPHRIQRRPDAGRGLVALHGGRKQREGKVVGRLLQLLYEVLKPRRGGRRDDGQSLRGQGQRQLLLAFEQAFFGQQPQRFQPQQRQFAHGVARVEGHHVEAQAVLLVETHLHPQQQLQAGAQGLARLLLEGRRQLLVALAPERGAGLGLHGQAAAVGGLLGEGEVAVRAGKAGHRELGYFGHHPVGVGQLLLQGLAHLAQQLGQAQRGRGAERLDVGATVVERHGAQGTGATG